MTSGTSPDRADIPALAAGAGHTPAEFYAQHGCGLATVCGPVRGHGIPPRREPRPPLPLPDRADLLTEVATPDNPLPLAVIRDQRGLSQVKLAARLGVGNSTISVWEGAASPARPLAKRTDPARIAVAVRLAAILEVEPLAIVECRRVLRPTAEELPPPERGQPDRRAALLPFVHWLRGALASRGWEPADLVQAMGIAEWTVTAWANGHRRPQPGQRAALCQVFGEPGLRQRLEAWAEAAHRPERGGDRDWTAEEDAYLLAHPGLSAPALAVMLGRTQTAVLNRRWRLGVTRRRDGGAAGSPLATLSVPDEPSGQG